MRYINMIRHFKEMIIALKKYNRMYVEGTAEHDNLRNMLGHYQELLTWAQLVRPRANK